MSNSDQDPDDFEDMSQYMQTFCDETEEQLEDLVETMLLLEKSSTDTEGLNEAFRLIHSIKGASGLMGLEQITILTHHLENRFERFRSGIDQIDEPTMNLVLKSVDFLRQCVDRLRAEEALGSPMELLTELRRLEEEGHDHAGSSGSELSEPELSVPEPESEGQKAAVTDRTPGVSDSENSVERMTQPKGDAVDPGQGDTNREAEASAAQAELQDHDPQGGDGDALVLTVDFRPEIQLADLKAQLILNRLSALGKVIQHAPPVDSIADEVALTSFRVWIESDEDADRLTNAADVDGVESVNISVADVARLEEPAEAAGDATAAAEPAPEETGFEEPDRSPGGTGREDDASEDAIAPASVEAGSAERDASVIVANEAEIPASETTEGVEADRAPSGPSETTPNAAPDDLAEAKPKPIHAGDEPAPAPVAPPATKGGSATAAKASETMRVGIDRLDKLMNLTGELVVNRARFLQISGGVSPELRKAATQNRVNEFCDSLRLIIEGLEGGGEFMDREQLVSRLRSGLEVLDEHSATLERDRQSVDQFSDAIDQLSRVSQGLQKGVLDTRMVPVGPLFTRFKRVTRDLSKERGKRVDLVIRGEKTELDKRMIDELGDPLVHLVRNSIDHGMESPDVRAAAGKAETGSVTLEAVHRGNNVYITVEDDGRGIDDTKIRSKLVSNGVLTQAAADELGREQALEYIWHPGFSTASEVTDVSGRGVGMDVVKDRIRRLNGNVEVHSVPGEGTRFTIRLPLTLAIINCLLVELKSVVLAISIEDVREIVSIKAEDIVDVLGKQTFELREKFVPLVGMEDLFDWREIDQAGSADSPEDGGANIHVVVMQSGGKVMGLRVDGLMGSQDIVVKSLSDNFMDIRGLSGASILGDGSVCLMLDVATVFHMAGQPVGGRQTSEDDTLGSQVDDEAGRDGI